MSTDDVLAFAETGLDQLWRKQLDATQAMKVANEYETQLQDKLREKLNGKLTRITGQLSSEERASWDGFIMDGTDKEVSEELVFVTSVSVEKNNYGNVVVKVHATYNSYRQPTERPGGKLIFFLHLLTNLEFVDTPT